MRKSPRQPRQIPRSQDSNACSYLVINLLPVLTVLGQQLLVSQELQLRELVTVRHVWLPHDLGGPLRLLSRE